MKKVLAWLMCLIMVFCTAAAAAEEADVLTINLREATDAELQEAATRIRNEQRSRLSTKVTLEPAEISVAKGSSVKVVPSVTDLPEGVKAGEFKWSVADENTATMAKDSVKGVNAGETTVTCTVELSDGTEVSGEAKIKVVIPVKSLKAKTAKLDVMAGDTFVPEFDITPQDATEQTVVFESSDESVVKVNEDGELLAAGVGKATVTATTKDGSKKSAKINVTVGRKIGKYDDELRFQGLAWGSDDKACCEGLQEAGIVPKDWVRSAYNSSYGAYLWPEDDMYFNTSKWNDIPVILQDKDVGIASLGITPEKKIGGYSPDYMTMYFLNAIDGDKIDSSKTELCGVYIRYDNQHEPGAEIFRNLLAKMEEQYGEFTKYIHKGLTRRYYKDVYDGIKDCMKNATQFDDRTLKSKDYYVRYGATCVLHGKNDTGIMLNIDTSGYVTLYYGNTKTWKQLKKIIKILEAEPDTTEDAGL